MKEIVRILFVLALATLLAFPQMALCDGVTLTLDGNGALALSGSGMILSDVLTQLSEGELARVTDVVIGNGISGVDGYAFERIGGHLVSITFPVSVTTLEPNILGTKGTLAYTICGNAQTLCPLLSSSNEDYAYFYTFEASTPKMPDLPAFSLAMGIAQEMAAVGAEMTLTAADELSDNHGNVRFPYTCRAPEDCAVRLTSFDGETIGQITIIIETFTPGAAWTALCRGAPQTSDLSPTDGIRETLGNIELNNNGRSTSANADGWNIRVGASWMCAPSGL